MFIRTLDTPNPEVLKFAFEYTINSGEPLTFMIQDAVKSHPLAEALFTISDILSIFIGSDFISIGKKESAEWFLLKPQIVAILMDYTLSGAPIFGETEEDDNTESDDSYSGLDLGDCDLNNPIIKQIVDIIEEKVRPAVAMDGGDIIFRGFKEGVVNVSLHGACNGCPSSTATLKDGMESMLKHYIPEVMEVKAV